MTGGMQTNNQIL
ncbi:Putative uncharacterized protein [Escherichia coli D6-117.29]|nr:Protein of unknown function [Escherichia coli D6-113.11]CDP70940.1 Protein of unknown function [Escherichia coli]CDP76083.1 Putative uncharacterized protein [Escherichia coli D6-117.29]CDU36663.1 Protein of unknown function [Escherichia coli D6-113.11]CDU38131.1 Protein of unknown function [Escherichia coli]